MSQRALADMLQLIGLDLDKNAVQKIESGNRFVTDIELSAFSKVWVFQQTIYWICEWNILDEKTVYKTRECTN